MVHMSQRDGTQHTMSYDLAAAAAATGLNKASILRAIKRGKISGTKDALGQWWVEPAELHRVAQAPARAHGPLVPDKIYPGMWRVVGPSGTLSDIVNETRANARSKAGRAPRRRLRASSCRAERRQVLRRLFILRFPRID